ncbi:MAG: hypothetical protein Q9204_001870 [Flavoplaca sp. TL-2023a]
MDIDHQFREFIDEWKALNAKLTEQPRLAESDRANIQAKEGEVADRERRIARNEQALSDGQRRFPQEQEKFREKEEKLKKKQEKLKKQQEKLKEEQEKLKEQQEKLKEGHSSLIEARGHFEAEKKTAEGVLRNLRLSEEVKLRVEALQQQEESIKSGIEQKATDQATRLISQLQLGQLPTQFVAAASCKFTRIEDCVAETEGAIINRLNALEGSLQEKDDWKRLGEK